MRKLPFLFVIAEFSFGGLPHDEAELNMRLFADRVMPVLQRDPIFRGGPEMAPTPPNRSEALDNLLPHNNTARFPGRAHQGK